MEGGGGGGGGGTEHEARGIAERRTQDGEMLLTWVGMGAFLSCGCIRHVHAYATTWCKLRRSRELLTLGYLQPRKARQQVKGGKKYTPCNVTRL